MYQVIKEINKMLFQCNKIEISTRDVMQPAEIRLRRMWIL